MNFAASADDIQRYCGRATITPNHAVTGALGTWRVVHTVGAYGLDIGGRLRLAFRLASDWGPLQVEDPTAPGYTSVESRPAGGSFRVGFDPRGHTRPWSQALLVEVMERPIAPGDQVLMTLGDTRGGSAGCRAQTFVHLRHRRGWPIGVLDFLRSIILALIECRGRAILGVAMVLVGILGSWWLSAVPGAILWIIILAVIEIVGWLILLDVWLLQRDTFI